MEKIRDADDQIIFFEFVGHCILPDANEPGIAMSMGGDVFGIGKNQTDWDDEGKGHNWYGIEDYNDLIVEVFDENALIEIEGCHSADGKTSIAYSFKTTLPHSNVWGYTGDCQYWPAPGVSETHESWTSESDWIEVTLPSQ